MCANVWVIECLHFAVQLTRSLARSHSNTLFVRQLFCRWTNKTAQINVSPKFSFSFHFGSFSSDIFFTLDTFQILPNAVCVIGYATHFDCFYHVSMRTLFCLCFYFNHSHFELFIWCIRLPPSKSFKHSKCFFLICLSLTF